MSIDDQLPQAYWSRAYAFIHLRRHEEAISTINAILSMTPNYADGYALLSIAHIYQGDPDNGIKMIHRAMRLNPNYPEEDVSRVFPLKKMLNCRTSWSSLRILV